MPPHPLAVEVTSRRGKAAKHYRNPDGTHSAVFSIGAVHYQATPGGSWLDKKQAFKTGPGTNEWISDESDVTMRTYQVGSGGAARWWVEFKETLSGRGIAFQLQFQPTTTVGSNVLSFSDGAGGTWTYTHTRKGGKMLGPSTLASVGSRSYTFTYQLLGGAPQLTQNADGSVSCGDIFRMAAPHLVGADGKNYAYSSWTVDAAVATLSFSYSDAGLPAAAYPYRVDPSSTFNIAQSGDDETVYKSANTYAGVASGGLVRVPDEANVYGQRDFYTGPSYYITNGLMWWDTGTTLPDSATVTGATLRMYLPSGGRVDSDNRNMTADWYLRDGTASDWSETAQTTAVTAYDHATPTLVADNDITLSNVSNVSKTGNTGLRLHCDGGEPTVGANYLFWASWNATTGVEPRLIVDYVTGQNDYIQLGADGSGDKKRTQSLTINSQTVHSGYDIQLSEAGDRARVLNAAPASSDYGMVVRRRDVDVGAVPVQFQATALAGLTAEALASISGTRDFAAVAAATTQTVPSTKTMRVYGLWGDVRRTTGTSSLQWYLSVSLRVSTSGAATATSPLALWGEATWVETASTTLQVGSEPLWVWLPQGVDVPAGASFGLSYITGSSTASRATVNLGLIGIEY